MENFQYTRDNVPLQIQTNNYERLREDQVVCSPAVVNMGPPIYPQVRDHIVWSVFNTIYMNFCCLGFAALVFSIKSRDRKVVGDLEGARHYGSTARCLNVTALVLTILTFLIMIILLAVGVLQIYSIAMQEAQNQHNPFQGNGK
ncbi:UNVERIFIED_CONTAM: hypothetical protein FKN15_074545 [Acipenser sinensis]